MSAVRQSEKTRSFDVRTVSEWKEISQLHHLLSVLVKFPASRTQSQSSDGVWVL